MSHELPDPEMEERLGAAFRATNVPEAPDRLRKAVAALDPAMPARLNLALLRRGRLVPAGMLVAAILLAVASVTLPGLLGPGSLPSPTVTPTSRADGSPTEPSPTQSSPAVARGLFLGDQPMSGDGWRILAVAGVSLGGVVSVIPPLSSGEPRPVSAGALVVWSPDALDKLWIGLGRGSDAPPTDPNRDVIVSASLLVGQGPICGQIRLDGVTFNTSSALVDVSYTDASAIDNSPAQAACIDIGVARSFVLAIDRAHLPVGPYTLRLDRDTGSTTQTTQIPAYGGPYIDPSAPSLAVGHVQNAAFEDANHGWALTTTGLYLSTNGGTTWVSRGPSLDYSAYVVRAVSFADASNGWVVSFDEAADSLYLWRTSDGGETWKRSVIDGTVFDSSRVGDAQISRIDARHAIIARQSGFFTIIYRTSDGGATWQAGPASSDGVIGDTRFIDMKTGWIAGVGSAALERTTDGGATFSAQSLPAPFDVEGLTPQILAAPRFFNQLDGLIAIDYSNDQGQVATVVARTTDRGSTWTLAGSFATGDVMAFGSLDAWAAWDTRAGVVRWTTSAGAEWSESARMDLPPDSEIHLLDPDHGWAFSTGVDPSGLYLTKDGGLTWRRTIPATGG